MPETFNFSGHETFHCRTFWLKKGYDHVKHGRTFTDPDAVVYLGVGKNMVTSIRFWLRAFDMADESTQLTELGKRLLDDDGWDPYLEDIGSLWLLHYHLVASGHASSARIIFNELRDRNPEFDAKTYSEFVLTEKGSFKDKTVETDFKVFVRNYYAKAEGEIDDLGGLLGDLELVNVAKVEDEDDTQRKARKIYFIERRKRPTLPPRILLYAILDSIPDSLSISLTVLMEQVGRTFALDKEGMFELLSELPTLYKNNITVSREAGVIELQFKKRPDRWTILADHYGN